MRGGSGSLRPKRCHHLRGARTRHALVTAAENGNTTAAGPQRPREFFDDRRLAGSADGEISNADDETAERALAQNAVAIKKKAKLHEPFVDEGERVKQRPEQRGPHAMTPFQDDVDGKLLEIFSAKAHVRNCGLRICGFADCQNPGAAIVGGGDDGPRAIGVRGGQHGARDFFGRTEGDGADRGTGSAQECAERAGGFGGGDHIDRGMG